MINCIVNSLITNHYVSVSKFRKKTYVTSELVEFTKQVIAKSKLAVTDQSLVIVIYSTP